MNKQEYLNQISMANRSMKESKSSKIMKSKFFWVGAIGVVAFIIIMVIGAAISSSRSSTKDRLSALILKINNTNSIIAEYRGNIKSSKLRSDSASLYSILSNTGQSLTNYAVEKYNYKEKDVKKDIVEEETLVKDEAIAELFNAKINGSLDSVYAAKMTYEISSITARETQIINATKDDMLVEILTSSYNSLSTLYNNFSEFSE